MLDKILLFYQGRNLLITFWLMNLPLASLIYKIYYRQNKTHGSFFQHKLINGKRSLGVAAKVPKKEFYLLVI